MTYVENWNYLSLYFASDLLMWHGMPRRYIINRQIFENRRFRQFVRKLIVHGLIISSINMITSISSNEVPGEWDAWQLGWERNPLRVYDRESCVISYNSLCYCTAIVVFTAQWMREAGTYPIALHSLLCFENWRSWNELFGGAPYRTPSSNQQI